MAKLDFSLPDTSMSSSSSTKVEGQRPRGLHNSKSFTRAEPASPSSRTRPGRATTISSGPLEYQEETKRPLQDLKPRSQSAAFAKLVGDVGNNEEDAVIHEEPEDVEERLPSDLVELPIELVSLTDRLVFPNRIGLYLQS